MRIPFFTIGLLIPLAAHAFLMNVPPGAEETEAQKINASDVAVTGTVESVSSTADANGWITSSVTLKVSNVLKGSVGRNMVVQFWVPGGCVPDWESVRCLYSDIFPIYKLGETRTIYLRITPQGMVPNILEGQ